MLFKHYKGTCLYWSFSWTDEGFHWTDDTPFQYEKWNLGEPNSNGEDDEDCVRMYTKEHDGSYWDDNHCDNFNPFMCKVEQGECDSCVLLNNFLPNRWFCLLKRGGICIVYSSPPGQNGRHFADDIFKCIFMNSLKFVPKGPIINQSALVEAMAWRRSGAIKMWYPITVTS